MALQPAEKELQEGRPLKELPSWLLPRLVSTGVFSTDEINQVLPLGDEGKFPQFPTLPMGCIWELSWTFLLVFLESFKQVWIASTKKTLLPPPVGLWVEVAANRYRGTMGIAAHVEDPVSFGPFGDGFWGEPDWKKMKMFPLPIGISHDSTRSQR